MRRNGRAGRAVWATVLAVCLTVCVGSGTAAAGDGGGGHEPSPVKRATASGEQMNGVDLWCVAYFTPDLQLDTSPPRRIHLGGHMDCNYGDPALWLTINLYQVVGNGDNQHSVFEEQFRITPRPGTSIGNSWVWPCVGTPSTRWQANLYAGTGTIGNLSPYPLWGSVYTFACG